MTKQIDVYIAYTQADEAWATELAQRLEGERIDGRPLRVFFAPWDVEPGKNFVVQLNKGLDRARFFAPVLTPEAVASDWVQREWSSALLKDVSGSAGRIIPMLRRTCNIPLFLRVLHYIDFRNPVDYEQRYGEFLQRINGGARGRGRAAATGTNGTMPLAGALTAGVAPDSTTERLESNLYPVVELPLSWFRVPSPVQSPAALVEIAKDRRLRLPPFIIRENHIISFDDPRRRSCALYELVDGGLVIEEALEDATANPSRKRWLVELLRRMLVAEGSRRGIAYDAKHRRFYFRKAQDGEKRREYWQSPKRRVPRTVAREIQVDGTTLRWEHFAGYLGFVEINGRLAMTVDPTWTFTKDGREPLAPERVTRLAMKKTYRDSNAAVLNDTRFWMMFLARDRDELRLGGNGRVVRIATTPLSMDVPVGLPWDTTVPDLATHPPKSWDNADGDEELDVDEEAPR